MMSVNHKIKLPLRGGKPVSQIPIPPSGELSDDLREMAVDQLIGLVGEDSDQGLRRFPDFSPLLEHLQDRLIGLFGKHQSPELKCKMELLHCAWRRAVSFSSEAAAPAWLGIISSAEEIIHTLIYPLPHITFYVNEFYNNELVVSTREVEIRGKVLTQTLLYLIVARAAYDRKTLPHDDSLGEYCEILRGWIHNQINSRLKKELILDSAINHSVEEYALFQDLLEEPLTSSQLKAAHLKNDIVRREFSANQRGCFAIDYTFHSSSHWNAVIVLRNLLYRVDQIERLLDSLKDGNVSFEFSAETTEKMVYQIEKITSNKESFPPRNRF